MKKVNVIVIFAILGTVISFSLWPVLSGPGTSPNCNDTSSIYGDCPSIEETTPRLVYLTGVQSFNIAGFSSRSEYCNISGNCISEIVAIPLSVIIGASAGACLGLLLSRTKTNKQTS